MRTFHSLFCVAVLLLQGTLFCQLTAPSGLPEVPFPADNPYSAEKAELGKRLYFDKRISSNGTISCASCHAIPKAFTDQKHVSIGIHGRKGTRNAPTVINAAYNVFQFWDGRAGSLEEQALGPIVSLVEMNDNDDLVEAYRLCEGRIGKLADYQKYFLAAFGTSKPTMKEISQAIATFERTVLSGNAPFDRWQAGDATAMTAEQVQGWEVFQHAGCIKCHSGPNFTSNGFANIGVGMDRENPDLGRYEATKKPEDIGKFKVPTLREVAYTYPYMHDGSLHTLEDVIEFYNRGGIANPNLSKDVKPLGLTEYEKMCLLQFMQSLCGEGWQHIEDPFSN